MTSFNAILDLAVEWLSFRRHYFAESWHKKVILVIKGLHVYAGACHQESQVVNESLWQSHHQYSVFAVHWGGPMPHPLASLLAACWFCDPQPTSDSFTFDLLAMFSMESNRKGKLLL